MYENINIRAVSITLVVDDFHIFKFLCLITKMKGKRRTSNMMESEDLLFSLRNETNIEIMLVKLGTCLSI